MTDKQNIMKQERIRNNMTQADLAKILDVDQRTISSWELGRTNPNPYFMQQIENIFGEKKEIIFFNLFNHKMNYNYNKNKEVK